jgi:ribosomal protein S18 acetylase RimI-like enzyme
LDLVPASQYSLQQLTEAYNKTRVDYLVPMPMTTRRLQEYIDVYDIDLTASVVALDGDEILGLCMLAQRGPRVWLTRLGVLPTSRRHGAGRAMMEYAVAQAADRRAACITLEVITGNTPAYNLFTGLGFEETRDLLILRRPPGPPPEAPASPGTSLTWLGAPEITAYAAQRTQLPAWTNQVESLHNVDNIRGLYVIEHTSETSGWVSFEQTMLQIKRVMIDAVNGSEPPANSLLYHLHNQFATLDTIAENIPADLPYLDVFYAHGYVESFARIEMKLVLNPAGE